MGGQVRRIEENNKQTRKEKERAENKESRKIN
jgi:hypothetical protein